MKKKSCQTNRLVISIYSSYSHIYISQKHPSLKQKSFLATSNFNHWSQKQAYNNPSQSHFWQLLVGGWVTLYINPFIYLSKQQDLCPNIFSLFLFTTDHYSTASTRCSFWDWCILDSLQYLKNSIVFHYPKRNKRRRRKETNYAVFMAIWDAQACLYG